MKMLISLLGSYPFQENDPFILRECPHVYFVGNQPQFATGIIEGPAGQQVRLIAVPKFKETGTLVLLDGETLEAETVTFALRQPKIANGH
jgi:DNA polymerase delta subunit 2